MVLHNTVKPVSVGVVLTGSFDHMRVLAEFVARVRAEKKLSYPAIKKRGGPAMSWVNRLENGQMVDRPKPETLAKLAKGLGVDYEHLMRLAGYVALVGETGKPDQAWNTTDQEGSKHAAAMVSGNFDQLSQGPTKSKKGNEGTSGGEAGGIPDAGAHMVPLYGPVAAGEPLMWSSEDAVRMVQAAPGDDAAFIIRGNSVSDYDIRDGDIVYGRRVNGEQPISGDMVVVESEGAYMCKVYRENKLGRYLESHEENKEPEPFLMTGEVHLIAIVTSYRKRFRRRG